ncbi:MAG: hypothetical protein JWO44_1197 [Bacteroidetes bacterium]|nr:hypothetical protein [Bacteroidota bacterium]
MANSYYTKNKFGAVILKKGTIAYHNFNAELQQSELFQLTTGLATSFMTEENKETARTNLIEIYSDPKNKASVRLVKAIEVMDMDLVFDVFQYEQFYSQMQYARSVDNIITYFKDILAEVVSERPEILKSSEVERLDFILQFETMEEFVDAMVEKKTEELFYRGIDKIEEFFINKLNLKLFKSDIEKNAFNLIIKNRNLIVHNRGRVNSQFLKEFPFLKFEKGQFLRYAFQDLADLSVALTNIAGHLDYEIAKKYKLKRIKIGN